MSTELLRRSLAILRVSLLPVAALALLAGCSRGESASGPAAAPERVQASAQASAPAAPSDKAETDSYAVAMKTTGAVKAGAEGSVQVTLEARGGYHINETYPYKFKAADPQPAGVTFPKPMMARDEGTFEKTKGAFQVPFVAQKPGHATVSGTLYLSVCSDASCIVDKVPLAVAVDAQ
jgi:Disulphide bond corrector protein DsbC